jgi:hypothetical protein
VSTLKDIRPDVVILPLLSRRGLYGSKGMDAWIAGVSQTVSEVSKFSRVVVLGDDPKVGFDVPGCLTTKHDPSKCSKDRKSAVLEDRLAAERMATELAGGRWFDISNWFCTKDSCPAVVAGLVVRRDDNHLTAAFSEYLWPRIDQIPMLLDID